LLLLLLPLLLLFGALGAIAFSRIAICSRVDCLLHVKRWMLPPSVAIISVNTL